MDKGALEVKYTVDEIRRMREAVETLTGSDGAEDRLRTYMQNGTTVEELEAAARQIENARMARQSSQQAYREFRQQYVRLYGY